MPAAKSEAPTVEYVHNVARGEHQIGVRFDGYFVPFVSIDDAAKASHYDTAKAVADADNSDGEDGA